MTTPRDIVLGSFIGDALALGPHWIYDPELIRKTFGRVTSYQSPLGTYHSGKDAGEFTHYGDQTLVLLGSLAEHRRFDRDSFARDWREFWNTPANISYRDGATRTTLENLESGLAPDAAGSDSHDIAGAARIAPLFLLNWNTDEELLEAVRAETSFTHRNPQVIEAAEYFARVVLAIRRGATVIDALDGVRNEISWKALPNVWFDVAERFAAGSESDANALETLGLSCDITVAFPGVIHLLRRYPSDPATSLIENTSAGGDSAARGMILGMIHGAADPVSTWPVEWLNNLAAGDEIEELITSMT